MDYKELKEKYIEVIDKRTETAKTFYKGDNKYCLVAGSTPIHYEENGEWFDIDVNIVDNKITKAPFTAEILTDSIGYSITSKKDGKRIDVKLDKIGLNEIAYVSPTSIENNIVKWENLATDFDLIIEFLPRRVRVWKILKSANASKEVTFRIFEDVDGDDLKTIDKIVGYDNKKRNTQSTRIVEDIRTFKPAEKEIKEYTIVETFENKVIERDYKTRKRILIEDVEYPVSIDADVQVGIATGADDGTDYKTTTITAGTTTSTSQLTTINNNINILNGSFSFGNTTVKARAEGFMRFDGITIPLSSTIDDATLKTYYQAQPAAQTGKVYAFDEYDASAPTTGSTGGLIDKTTGIASNVVTEVFSTATTYTLKDIDIKTIVQELVNSYDYSNEAMVFFMRPVGLASTVSAIAIYAHDQGTTQDPELIINYTSGAAAAPSIELSTHTLSAAYGDNTIIQNPPTQTFTITNSGASAGDGTWLNWSAESSGGAAWLSLNPSAGSIHTSASYTDTVSASFDCTTINRGTYEDYIKVFDVNADNSPHYVETTFTIAGSAAFARSADDIYKLSDTATNTANLSASILSDIFNLSEEADAWLKEGEVTWGYETPSAGYGLSWSNWVNEAGATTPTSGNSDWGRIYLQSDERSLSSVERIADDSNIEVMRDRYPSGGFGPIRTYIRGQDTSFVKTTPSGTLAWIEYTQPVVKSWKYVQVMVEAL